MLGDTSVVIPSGQSTSVSGAAAGVPASADLMHMEILVKVTGKSAKDAEAVVMEAEDLEKIKAFKELAQKMVSASVKLVAEGSTVKEMAAILKDTAIADVVGESSVGNSGEQLDVN